MTEAELPTVDDAEHLLKRARSDFRQSRTQADAWSGWPRPEPCTVAAAKHNLTPWVVLRHIVNHSTYHRGQVASKLKRLGIEQPATVFVFWAFEQNPTKRPEAIVFQGIGTGTEPSCSWARAASIPG